MAEEFFYDNLLAGNGVQPVVTQPVTVAANQSLERGALFELNVNGEAIVPTGAPIDPAKVYGVMAETVVTDGSGTAESVAYMSAEFNERKLIVPAGITLADYKEPLRKLGIYLKSTVSE
jgi:hypothetical protein